MSVGTGMDKPKMKSELKLWIFSFKKNWIRNWSFKLQSFLLELELKILNYIKKILIAARAFGLQCFFLELELFSSTGPEIVLKKAQWFKN